MSLIVFIKNIQDIVETYNSEPPSLKFIKSWNTIFDRTILSIYPRIAIILKVAYYKVDTFGDECEG